MTAKMDEIKVSVNDTDENKEVSKPSPKKAKPVPKKKKVKTATAAKKANNVQPKAKAKTKGKKSGGFFSLLVSVAVTAAIVGGAVYAWQKSTGEKVVEEINQEAQKERMTFEDRLNKLKNRLTGVETEKEELEEKAMELDNKAKLLNKAKIEFVSDEMKFEFEYPARFGELSLDSEDAATGTRMIGSFSENDKLVIGGVSKGYMSTSTVVVPAVTDTQGFIIKNRAYYILGPQEQEYEVNPARIIEFDESEAILIDKNSFVLDEEADGLPVDIGNNVAVYLNLETDTYKGLSLLNSDFGMLPLEDFVKLVESLKIIK